MVKTHPAGQAEVHGKCICMLSKQISDRIGGLLNRYLTIVEVNVDDRNDFRERRAKFH